MFIITHKNFFFVLSAILMIGSAVLMTVFTPWKFGIEFTGGTLLEVSYPDGRPTREALTERVHALNWAGTALQETGEQGFIIRTKSLTEEERQSLMGVITENGTVSVVEERFNSIGPTIGRELREKALWAILAVLIAIVCYIAFAFRGVSHPVSSWTYGFVAIVALVHDVLIPAGVYITLGHYFIDVQIDVLFVTAILTILGFSIHDTIVVFDRTRENLKLRTSKDFGTTVGHSLEQTFVRSINTSLTVLIVILALYFVGGETTKNFALVLGVGILAGTYSSIFLASPLLVAIEEYQRKKGSSVHHKK